MQMAMIILMTEYARGDNYLLKKLKLNLIEVAPVTKYVPIVENNSFDNFRTWYVEHENRLQNRFQKNVNKWCMSSLLSGLVRSPMYFFLISDHHSMECNHGDKPLFFGNDHYFGYYCSFIGQWLLQFTQ